MIDFFVSYAEPDRLWAEWIAWQLSEAGYTVGLQAWDFHPGANFVLEMQRLGTGSRHVVAVLSENYVARRFPQAEWAAAFASDPIGVTSRLLPVRIHDFRPEGLLASIVNIDLVGLAEAEARSTLLAGVAHAISGRAAPASPPRFPGRP